MDEKKVKRVFTTPQGKWSKITNLWLEVGCAGYSGYLHSVEIQKDNVCIG